MVARPCTWYSWYHRWRLFALSEGKANPCWRAPPDRGCEFQDVPSVKELPITMYRIRPCHKMIPLFVKIRTHAVSSCGPGAALSTLSPRFRHLRSCTKWCDYLPVRWGHVISLSYKRSISSQTRSAGDPVYISWRVDICNRPVIAW